MTVDELYSTYKKYRDYADGNFSILPQHYVLRDTKQREFAEKLLEQHPNTDWDKFFRANCALKKRFFLYMSNTEQAFNCYNELDDYIARNRDRFVKELFEAYSGVPKPLNLEDRDTFLQVAAEVDPKIWAVLMPDVQELLQSLSDFTFINRVYRFHLVAERMRGYDKIRAKFREKILPKS